MKAKSPSLENSMNCFEWQARVSDFLDDLLEGPEKVSAHEHLESCPSCADRHKHYRLILSSLASQPRSSLPVPIRKAPLSAVIPKLESSRIGKGRWDRMPWYLRTVMEGGGIVLLILVGTTAGPRIRAIYERNLEKSLNEFSDTLTSYHAEDPSKGPAPMARGNLPANDAAESKNDDYAAGENESEEDSEEVAVSEDQEIHVGKSEIWRFNMKTDSPHEIRPKIVQMLTDVKVPTGTPGFAGIEAPGGIQFDLLVPSSTVPAIKRELQQIAPPAPEGTSNAAISKPFTWYKNKSKRKLPDGETRVVIWLSQM